MHIGMLSNIGGHCSRRLFFHVSAVTSYIKRGYGSRFGRHVTYELQIQSLITNSFILNWHVGDLVQTRHSTSGKKIIYRKIGRKPREG